MYIWDGIAIENIYILANAPALALAPAPPGPAAASVQMKRAKQLWILV